MVFRMIQGRLLLALFLGSVAGVSACRNDSRSGEASANAQANTREAVFRVEGMTCASCNATVKVAAERVRGVRSARADSAQGRAWVTFDPATTSPTQIAAAISETGYQATAIEGAEAAPAASTGGNSPEVRIQAEVACRVLRDGVYRQWPEIGRAPRPREIARALSMTEPEVNRALEALSSREFPCGSIERAHRSDRIVFAWPFSNVPTEYVVKIQGSKPVYGRCAIDALGVSAMFGRPVEIEATSVSSGAPIRIAVNGTRVERAEPAEAVVWVAGEECGCDEMVIFANRAELAEWRRILAKPEGRTLSLEDATAYGVRVFGNRLHVN